MLKVCFLTICRLLQFIWSYCDNLLVVIVTSVTLRETFLPSIAILLAHKKVFSLVSEWFISLKVLTLVISFYWETEERVELSFFIDTMKTFFSSYSRDYVVEGNPYSGFDRHNGEIAAFHLDRYKQLYAQFYYFDFFILYLHVQSRWKMRFRLLFIGTTRCPYKPICYWGIVWYQKDTLWGLTQYKRSVIMSVVLDNPLAFGCHFLLFHGTSILG